MVTGLSRVRGLSPNSLQQFDPKAVGYKPSNDLCFREAPGRVRVAASPPELSVAQSRHHERPAVIDEMLGRRIARMGIRSGSLLPTFFDGYRL